MELGTENLENTTPEFTAMSLKANAAHAYAQDVHRETLGKQLQGLLESGRCTPYEHKQRSGELGTVKLSLDKAGKPASGDLEKWIASRDAVPEGTMWDSKTRTDKLSLEKTEPPKCITGVTTKEDAKKLVDEVYGVKK